jgi:N utilization substance protein A
MKQTVDLIQALNQVAKEKGIDKEVIFEAIESSLISACKKHFGTSQNIRVLVDRETGNVKIYAQKQVVEDVEDDILQISLEAARKIDPQADLEDMVDVVVMPKNFGRISAQTAKQVVVQKFREAEREILYNEFITKERDIVTGIVQRKDRRDIFIALGRVDAVLTASEQSPGEEYEFQDRVKVYVTEVRQTTKGPMVHVSRTHPELVRRLFEQEVPEVHNSTVEIKAIAREAGARTKVAVWSKNKDVDAVGACVGQNGYRVNVVVAELRGEKIDVIAWNEDPRKFIAAALNPSKVSAVALDADGRNARVVVPDSQLSLAIGKDGQNVRLAARLTNWRIDIKSETGAQETGFVEEEDYFFATQPQRESFAGSYVPYEDYDEEYDDEYSYEEVYGEDAEEYGDAYEGYADENSDGQEEYDAAEPYGEPEMDDTNG